MPDDKPNPPPTPQRIPPPNSSPSPTQARSGAVGAGGSGGAVVYHRPLAGVLTPAMPVLERLIQRSRPRRIRSLREFAEQEIVLPTGPFQGSRFRIARNPHVGLLYDEIDSGRWRRMFATGPTQSGKTLAAFVIPTLYHLFEIQETVLCGLPSLDIVKDKWTEDLLPAIAASKYRDLLPDKGSGSKGGNFTRITFRNGQTLRFMTAGGGDKSRAAFTSRVLVVSEVDGFDEIGGASRESDKFTQLEQRTTAFGDRARIYGECTVSTEDGRTWQEYQRGTRSRIGMRCPHCSKWVTPEREHLVGWKTAADELEARDKTELACPECGCTWNDAHRATAAADSRLIHHGQTFTPDGKVDGPPPRTDTLGFRWTAANNLLVSLGEIGRREWRATRSASEAASEKEMRQFVWALPHEDDARDINQLSHNEIAARVTTDAHGLLPSDTEAVTVGIDVGQYLIHWVAIAWRPHVTPHIPEYGTIEVPSRMMGVEEAIQLTLRRLRDEVLTGWVRRTAENSPPIKPLRVCVDAGNWQTTIQEFVKESAGYYATKGQGFGQYGGGGGGAGGGRPKGSKKIRTGDHWEEWFLPGHKSNLVEFDSDHWKSYLHARLETPTDKHGAMTLSLPPPTTPTAHLSFARSMLSEKKVEEFVAGKGTVTRWHREHRNNHYLDATALACIAASLAGRRTLPVDLVKTVSAPRRATMDKGKLEIQTGVGGAEQKRWGLRTPDGRPFHVTRR